MTGNNYIYLEPGNPDLHTGIWPLQGDLQVTEMIFVQMAVWDTSPIIWDTSPIMEGIVLP